MKTTVKTIPAPTTGKALKQGCLCGKYSNGVVAYHSQCPLHGDKKKPRTLAIN